MKSEDLLDFFNIIFFQYDEFGNRIGFNEDSDPTIGVICIFFYFILF